MANTFYREAISGGDSGIWDTYELPQNRNVEGNISCKLYDDSGTLKITVGRIGFNDGTNRGTMVIDTVTTISLAAVSNGNWAKIEMALSGGAPVFTAADISGATSSTTLPAGFTGAWDGNKQGYYIASNKRCIGLAWKESGGSLDGIINTSPYEEGYYGSSEDTAFFILKGHDLSKIIQTSNQIEIRSAGLKIHGTAASGTPTEQGIIIGESGDNTGIEISGADSSSVCYIDFGYAGSGDYKGRIIYDNSNNSLQIHTNSGARITIESNGDVGIGTTTPEASLQVVGNLLGNPTTKGIHIGMSSGNDAGIELKANSSSDSAYIDFGYPSDGDYKGRIVYTNSTDDLIFETNGNNQGFKIASDQGIYFASLLGTTGGSDARYDTSTKELFYDTSAAKYKENIRPAEDVDTDFLHSIPVKKFDRKDGIKIDEIGIIAEDLAAVKPDLVCKNEKDEIESYSKGDLVPYLLLEIQKLKKEIDILKGA